MTVLLPRDKNASRDLDTPVIAKAKPDGHIVETHDFGDDRACCEETLMA